MSVTVAQLVARVAVEGAEDAKNQLSGIGGAVGKAQGIFGVFSGGVAGVASVAGAALLGIGIASVKMAGDFQQGMTTLVTGAGESKNNLKLVSDGILSLATSTGTSTKQLTDGMYMIESAGYHGAAGLNILKAAAEGAKVGNASLATVANGVTTAMTDYASKNLTAAQATNTLIATVAAGKTNMTDLSNSMSTILPTAAAMNVKFGDVSAAMATMTGEGTNAANASTYLRQLLTALENPAKKGAAALQSIGLSSVQVSDDMKKSLPDTLALITDNLKKKFPEGSAAYVKALADISGGSKQMQGMLQLTGDHLTTLQGNLKSITDAVKSGKDSIQGWSDVQGNFNFQLSRAQEVVETTGIKIGSVLLPPLTKLAGFLLDNIGPAVQNVGKLLTPLGGQFEHVGSVLGGQLGASVKALAGALQGQFSTALKDVSKDAQQLGGWFETSVLPTLKKVEPQFASLASAIIGNLLPALLHMRSVLMDVAQNAFEKFAPIIEKIVPPLIKFAGILAGDVANGIRVASPLIDQISDAIGKFANDLIDRIAPIVVELFNEFSDDLQKFQVLWVKVWPYLSVIIKGVWQEIEGVVKIAWALVTGIINIGLDLLSGNWKQAWLDLFSTVQGVWSGIQTFLSGEFDIVRGLFAGAWAGISTLIETPFQNAWNFISGIFNNMLSGVNQIENAIGSLGSDFSVAKNAVASVLPHFASGTSYAPGGAALVGENGPEMVYLPRGAQVVPNNKLAGLGGNITIVVQPADVSLDGHTLARGLLPHISNAIRYNVGTHGR